VGETTAPATAITDRGTYDVVVRPRAALVRSTALSIVFSAVPLAVALVWVSFPLQIWAVLASVVVVLGGLVGLLFIRLRSAFVGLGPDGVTVRGVLTPRSTVARDTVAGVVLATTFGSSVDRTSRELVALDAEGTRLFRMRADVWGDTGLEQIVDGLGVQVTELGRPLSTREFSRRHPAVRTRRR